MFDLRAGGRLLSTVPFNAGPTLLRFHPTFSSTIFVVSTTGMFGLMDVNGTTIGSAQQIPLEHGSLSAIAVAPTGDCVVLGSQQGALHLIARVEEPQVHVYAQVQRNKSVASRACL